MTDNYALPISKAKAKVIFANNKLQDKTLPQLGYETLVDSTDKDRYGFSDRLYLQNITGQYQLYCCSQPVNNWKEVFKNFNFCGVI